MSKLISISIDLSKIDKSQIKTTDKDGNPFKNGAKYLNVTMDLKDHPDQFGNHCSLWHSQTKEQRDAKEARVFIGNGKVFWSGQSHSSANDLQNAPSEQVNGDDLPF